MKKTLKLLALLLCIAPFAVGITSCESQEQKEARAKALAEQQKAEAEKKRVLEQLKTESGLRQFLAGKTFAYSGSTETFWLKVTFTSQTSAVVYRAFSSDRSWGKGHQCSIEIVNPKDAYGKYTGDFKIRLNDNESSYQHWIFDWYYGDDIYLETTATAVNISLHRYTLPITLSKVNTDYFPKEWKD